jgi:hypothetical protein
VWWYFAAVFILLASPSLLSLLQCKVISYSYSYNITTNPLRACGRCMK